MENQDAPGAPSRLVAGGLTAINTPVLVQVAGQPEIILEYGANDSQLLLTADVYDSDGVHVAKLRRNAWAFGDDAYELGTHPQNLSLTRRSTGTTLLRAEVAGPRTIRVTEGRFYTSNGVYVEISRRETKVGPITMSEVTVLDSGAVLAL